VFFLAHLVCPWDTWGSGTIKFLSGRNRMLSGCVPEALDTYVEGQHDHKDERGHKNEVGTHIDIHHPTEKRDFAEDTCNLGWHGLRNKNTPSLENTESFICDRMAGNGDSLRTSQSMAAQSLSGQKYESYTGYGAPQPAIAIKKRNRAVDDDDFDSAGTLSFLSR
jgi:hypothetical protein